MTMPVQAATTIDATNKYAWSGNLGWSNWRDAGAHGVSIGEYVCSGYVWLANCGWIHLGDGSPANGVHYSNTSGSDYGVNLQDHYSIGDASKAKLRGFAYAGNLGWINFETQGNPEVSLQSGRLSGHVWSANCGWINLNDITWFVETDTILPGVDNDADGIADAFELDFTDPDTLALLTKTGDADGDGKSDVDEYVAGTNPVSAQFRFNVTGFEATCNGATLTWSSSVGRLYRIRSSTNLLSDWELLLDNIVPDGSVTTRSVTVAAGAKRFFRVEAFQPLAPCIPELPGWIIP